jgi:hypothetical protein
MDILTLTDSRMEMSLVPVRIKEIEEDSNYILSILAEDFIQGVSHAQAYPRQENLAPQINHNIHPGDVNVPIIFLAPSELWQSADKPEIWIVATGENEFWGGCDIHVSHDNLTYSYCGTIFGVGKQGSLSAALPIGGDPDSVNTCSVDLSISNGGLLSGTQVDADNLVTLCIVIDGSMELISYQTATLTDTNQYDLTYLRRGAKGTPISFHGAGAGFARLDEKVFKLPFDSVWLANTAYFKFCSFNIWKVHTQNLADVEAYQIIKRCGLSDTGSGADEISVVK